MAIPEAQLGTWSHQGAVSSSQHAHSSIRNALASNMRRSSGEYEVYLQGSYKNDTNIYGNSDVDVVVQLNTAWHQDIARLNAHDQYRYLLAVTELPNAWSTFRHEVRQALVTYFGTSSVIDGKKSIKVDTPYLTARADVVVCVQFRNYHRFTSLDNRQDYVEGLSFPVTGQGQWIVNYPKLHYANGIKVNATTGGWFKPIVRIFKNVRDYAVEHLLIEDSIAPSYFVECLISNIPESIYRNSYQASFWEALCWLISSDFSVLMCLNNQVPLFGRLPEQWNEHDALLYLAAALRVWKEWH